MAISYSQYLAIIDGEHCIGCTLCIKACPFDAIIGASKQLHSVIDQFCTGCKLCVPPCPVDCISIIRNQEFEAVKYSSDTKQQKKQFSLNCKLRVKEKQIRANKKTQQQVDLLSNQKRDLDRKLDAIKKSSIDR